MNAIEAHNLGKRYWVRGETTPTLFGAIQNIVRRRPRAEFWALRNVNFEIPKGRTVAVIGPNGSGKSSTLGLIAGTITPTEGTVQAHGLMSTLLELGAGFHPDLTGRENAYLNAAILGIPHEDLRKRFDHIVEFAGIGDFIDAPVKQYSSGMYVRLGFAVAVELNPDILLVDEVLAVGDIAFQLKCLDRIRQFQKQGKTILLVSHALQTVEEFCDEALLIHQGSLVARGEPADVILDYIKSYMGEGGHIWTQEFGTREVEIIDTKLVDKDGVERGSFESGQPMYVDIHYDAHQRVEKPVFGYSIKTGNGFYIHGTNTQFMKVPVDAIEGRGVMRLKFAPLTLLHGNFFLSLSIHSWDHATQYHRREDWYPFSVSNPTDDHGVFHVTSAWEHQPPS